MYWCPWWKVRRTAQLGLSLMPFSPSSLSSLGRFSSGLSKEPVSGRLAIHIFSSPTCALALQAQGLSNKRRGNGMKSYVLLPKHVTWGPSIQNRGFDQS